MLVNQLRDLLKRKGIAYQDAPAPLQILASVGIVAAEGNAAEGMSDDDKKLLESIYAALTAGLDQVAATIMNAVKGGDAPKAEPVQASAKTTATDDTANKARAIDLLYSKALVRDRLAESCLPEQAKTLLASKFNGRVVTEHEVDAEIETAKKLLASTTDSGKPKDMGKGLLASGLDYKDKARIAMHKMLGVKPTDAEASQWQSVPAFKGIRAAYHEMTGDGERVTGRVLASAWSSTDMPQALGDSMHRRLLQEYRESPVMAMNLVTVETSIRDFRSNYVVQMGGLEDLAEVTETGGYGEAAVPSDSEASYAVKTYGKHVRLTRVFIKNDSLNALNRIVAKIRRAATRSLNKYIFDLMLNYSGSINGGTIYDSKALYHNDHANIQTGAFSYANLWALRGLINAQREADSSEPLDLEPSFLIVPKELEKDALIYLNSAQAPSDTINDVNVLRMKNMTLMVVDKTYLRADANNYYVMASPADAEGIVMGFMDGQVEPELFLQDGPTEGNVFGYDHITYKVRHEYGGCVVDYRPLAAGIVT